MHGPRKVDQIVKVLKEEWWTLSEALMTQSETFTPCEALGPSMVELWGSLELQKCAIRESGAGIKIRAQVRWHS